MMCTPLGVLYMIKRDYVNYLKYGIIIRIRKLNEYNIFSALIEYFLFDLNGMNLMHMYIKYGVLLLIVMMKSARLFIMKFLGYK